ncbi:MAG: type II toxin-antitoxin system RelE/ParE family toxin [Actinomycetota bacterium]
MIINGCEDFAPSHRTRFAELIQSLAQDPRPVNSKKLTTREEWRLRYGNYRILYTIDDENKTITFFISLEEILIMCQITRPIIVETDFRAQ